MEKAPVANPASGPNAHPVIITMAAIGLHCGSIKNATRATAETPHITERITISRIWILRSKKKKKGKRISPIRQIETI